MRGVEVEEDDVSEGSVEVSVCEKLCEDFNGDDASKDLADSEDANEFASKRRRRMFHIVWYSGFFVRSFEVKARTSGVYSPVSI